MTPEIPTSAFRNFAMGLDHPKSLAFDRAGFLWTGGEAGQVYRIAHDGKAETVAVLGGFCGGLAFSPDDELFVCNPRHGIVRVLASGEFEVFADKAGEHRLACPNFGLFDDAGNYYVTDSGAWGKGDGWLMRFRPDGTGEKLAGPLGYAAGLALSRDGRALFLAESDTERILRFDVAADGSVGDPEVYAEQCGRVPDGLALDVEGCVYVCCYASDEIWRINLDREKALVACDRHSILLGSPTGLAFGGADFAELYVANVGRTSVSRVRLGRKGQPLANQRVKRTIRPRPLPL